jgi:hypothetical protein
LSDDIFDHLAGLFDARTRLGRENHLFPALCDVYDLLESKLLTVKLKHSEIADFRLPISN